MGGSGGSGWSNRPPKDLDKLITAAEGETGEKYQKTQVENFLNEKLEDFNDHDYEKLNQHREQIERKLQSEFENFEALLYGGSHSRYTDVNKLSDIDILAVLGDTSQIEESSNVAINNLVTLLRDRFPESNIQRGKMAATIRFSDGIEIQVLPAYRDGDGFYIPNPADSRWVRTCPTRVANQLTGLNQQLSGKVVPVIKLAKAICYAKGIEIKSYHLENIALQAFSVYTGQKTQSQMLKHLFNQAKTLVLLPMSDPCGQSADITSNLTSNERTKLAKGFSKLENSIETAMTSSSLEPWNDLFQG